MYRDYATLRAGRWTNRNATAVASCFALFVSTGLIGCVGSVGEGLEDPTSTTTPDPTQTDPNNPKPPVNVPPPAATTCDQDKIGVSPLRRLTRQEYDNPVKDLLGVDLKLAKRFNEDEKAGVFPGNYFTPISEALFGQYAAASAEAAAKAVEQLAQLLPCAATVQANNEQACATNFIRQFGRRAFRRPLDDAEVSRYQELFKTGRDGANFGSGIGLVVEGILESPHFIYLVEGPGALTQHQLASRLSYFLWTGPPDAKLAALADSGGLRTPEAMRNEAKRLLADPRAQDMLEDFHMRWLVLDDLETGLTKEGFPEFDAIQPLLREETRRFATEVYKGDGKLDTLLTAPWTMANGVLAKQLYGVNGGNDWQKVSLDASQGRGGILTQGSFLATHGHEGSSPIFRGIAVREQFFCIELPPPPPGADANLPEASPTKTTRDRVEQHRQNPECASCHNLMDTIGYGFEAYDLIGKYRTTENNIKVDDSGELLTTDIDGKFKGAAELSRKMAGSAMVQKCVTTHWFRYALGRVETDLDKCSINAVVDGFKKSGFNLQELLLAMVESDGFRIRRGEETSR